MKNALISTVSSTTNLIIFILTLALIFFTYKHITDPKDFIGFLLCVASYKFGRNQASTQSPSNSSSSENTIV